MLPESKVIIDREQEHLFYAGRPEVLNYYDQRHIEDVSNLVSNEKDIAKNLGNIRNLHRYFRPPDYEQKTPGYTVAEYTSPLRSQTLLRYALRGLKNVSSRKRHKQLKFLGETLIPLTGVTLGDAEVEAEWASTDSIMCSSAEEYFKDAHDQINSATYTSQPIISVYYNQDKQPVLLEKSVESKTALSLTTISVEGLKLPAGTIVALADIASFEPINEVDNAGARLVTYEFTDIPKIHPLRLSPWAYSSRLDQQLFAVDYISKGIYESRSILIDSVDIEDFTQAANKLIEKCDATNPDSLF